MNIDWSKAPEGATHFHPKLEGKFSERWFMSTEHGWKVWYMGEWHASTPHLSGIDTARFVERQAEWTGTGLPPVGTVCEVFDRSPDEYWARHVGNVVTIVAHDITTSGSRVAVYSTLDDQGYKEYHGLVEECFRPIRTQEQIEAEERKAALEEMFQVSYAGDIWHILGSLYDAGYRKQPKDDA